MAKPKPRHLGAVPANKNIKPRGGDVDLAGEESWVIVKKQRVNILIPPLPVTEIPITRTPGPSELPVICAEKTNQQRRGPLETRAQMHSVDDKEKSITLVPQLPSLHHRTVSENPNRVDKVRICSNTLGVASASKVSKLSISYLDRALLLKQRMRASNLERKLRRAGGLSRWLTSIGLDRFVKIFQSRSVSKFQLVNMTMKKLKDMGADPVGPRRKLMHAIDCLCQPYCFEAA